MVLSSVKLLKELKNKGTIVAGAGGAGDIVSAYIICEILKDMFDVENCLPLAILWERWIVDPFPGPIPKDLVKNARISKCIWVNPKTYVDRSTYHFRPQATIISEVMGKDIP